MAESRPNILVFMTDDHGLWANGCYGNREVWTPSLDHLAATGARLDQAFTPCPVCSPARASFFTGRLPSQHGIHDWLKETDPARTHPGIDEQVNLAELLQAAGYYTGLVGKWHCGRGWTPKRGFDRWFGYQESQYPHFGRQRFSDQGRPLERHGHQAAFLTEEALRFLRERPAERPFFLFVGYVNTHTPHADQPERLVDRYRRARFDDVRAEAIAPCHGVARNTPPSDRAAQREQLAQYYAAVTTIDEQVGRILDELDGQGQRAGTLVVYTSDHGHMNGQHGLRGKGNATIPQNLLDESIRVPCLLSWPDGLAAGQVRTEPADHCDLFNTLLDVGQATPGETLRSEIDSPGASFWPLLTGQGGSWRGAQFCEYGNARLIRTPQAKLIRRYHGPNGRFPDEFYDLQVDPRETRNVIADPRHAATIAGLSAQLEAHFARYAIPERSGAEIDRQPSCNPNEPWRAPVGADHGR